MKKGLVLEGGAMRGLFTAGVMDVLMENNVEFDGAIGISAGATFGCNYKSRQPGRVLRYNKRFCSDKRYGSLSNFFKTGDLFDVDFCYRELPFELDIFDSDAFKNNPMEFYLGATDVVSGKAIYKKIENGDEADIKWIQASASIPLLSRPVEIDGGLYLDGGISDSIPLEFFESIGYDRNVVILTRPADYKKKRNKFIFLSRLMLGKYPEFIKTFKNRHLMYNREREYVRKLEKEGKIVVVCPAYPLEVKGNESNPEALQKAYDLGRMAGEAKLEEIKRFLAE